jgi:GntR family transcriptional regulator
MTNRITEKDPVHLSITERCRRLIVEGEIAAGERFPSERELALDHGVSRATSNKVINNLVAEGLLEIEKGIGARVVQRPALFASLAGMESFTSHMIENGMTPSTRVLTFRKRSAKSIPAAVRGGLGLDRTASETIIYLERLRLADGEAMILECRWIREALAPGLVKEDVSESFYRILEEKYRMPMTGEQHSISAGLLDASAAEHMGLALPAAALCVEGVGFVSGDVPLWYQKLLYHGARYEIFNQTHGLGKSRLELRLK